MTNKLSLEELGTIVNDIKPDPELLEVEEKIESLADTKITITLRPVLFERLRRLAEFQKVSLEDFCQGQLDESTAEQVGKATISGPSNLSGKAVKQKVTGPSFLTSKL